MKNKIGFHPTCSPRPCCALRHQGQQAAVAAAPRRYQRPRLCPAAELPAPHPHPHPLAPEEDWAEQCCVPLVNSTSRLYSTLAKTQNSSAASQHPEYLESSDPKELLGECRAVPHTGAALTRQTGSESW